MPVGILIELGHPEIKALSSSLGTTLASSNEVPCLGHQHLPVERRFSLA